MAYIGAPPLNRVLSSADIAQGAVTLDDINFTDQPVNMDITGTIDKHTMRLADGVTITGDVTISDDLVLSKISDDGNAITMTNDGSSRTITGSGSIEASTLSQTPNQSLTGMTGTVGSAVTGGAGLSGMTSLGTVTTGTLGSAVTGSPALNLGNATFPAGHIIKVSTHSSTVDVAQTGTGQAKEADANDLTVTCTIGNRLHIWIIGGFTYATATTGYFQCGMIIEESGQSDVLSFPSYLYSRASGDYKNDSHVSVTYSHTAITSSVTVKRAIQNPATAVTSYWQAVNGYGVRYLIMEEQK